MDDTASAADIAALGRTVRRCTAVLVLAIGIHLVAVTPGESDWGVLLAALAGCYLLASVVNVDRDDSETESDEPEDAGADGRSGARSDPGG